MKTWIGAAIVTATVTIIVAVGGPAATAAASTKPTTQTADKQRATNLARGVTIGDRHGYRPHYRPQPHCYARPYYYRPYPYSVPAPFTFGFGFGPGWW